MNMFIFDAADVKLFGAGVEGDKMSASELNPGRSRRQTNKEDKARRIGEAARAAFISKGYDEASMREIAAAAGVALGTLFIYAANKRDLLFLVVNDELEAVAKEAEAAVRPEAPMMANFLAAYRPIYAFFGREPRLSRLTLREMMFYETGSQAKRFVGTRNRLVALSVEIVRIAQKNKDIASKEDCQALGTVLFAIFQIEIRTWLTGGTIDLAKGLDRLRRSLATVIKGLAPAPRALHIKAGRGVPAVGKRKPALAGNMYRRLDRDVDHE
jgi:AcrR family transcriptional regulator